MALTARTAVSVCFACAVLTSIVVFTVSYTHTLAASGRPGPSPKPLSEMFTEQRLPRAEEEEEDNDRELPLPPVGYELDELGRLEDDDEDDDAADRGTDAADEFGGGSEPEAANEDLTAGLVDVYTPPAASTDSDSHRPPVESTDDDDDDHDRYIEPDAPRLPEPPAVPEDPRLRVVPEDHRPPARPPRVDSFMQKDRDTVNPRDVTLATHLTVDRLPALREMMRRWAGPFAVCVYLRNASRDYAVWDAFVHREHQFAPSRLRWSTYITNQELVTYPANILRNRALRLVQTNLVLLLDADFVPDEGLYASLVSQVDTYNELSPYTVWALPAFEFKSQRAMEHGFPANKSQVPSDRRMWARVVPDGISMTHAYVCTFVVGAVDGANGTGGGAGDVQQ